MSESACQGFEITIEMRRHGAADPDASQRLDEHLRECADCRSYERLGAETEVGLRSDAEEASAKADLKRLRARGRRILGGIWSDVAAFFVLLSLAFLPRIVLGVPGIDPSLATLNAILMFALPFVYLRRSRRELDEPWSSETLFSAMRTDVGRRLKGSVFLAAVFIAAPVLSIIVGAPDHGLVWSIARSLYFVCFGVLGLFVLIIRVPRLLRERREIPMVPDPYQHSSESFFGLP